MTRSDAALPSSHVTNNLPRVFARAAELVAAMEQRLADVQAGVEHPVTVHINGCPNSCARIQTADIGFDHTRGVVGDEMTHLGCVTKFL